MRRQRCAPCVRSVEGGLGRRGADQAPDEHGCGDQGGHQGGGGQKKNTALSPRLRSRRSRPQHRGMDVPDCTVYHDWASLKKPTALILSRERRKMREIRCAGSMASFEGTGSPSTTSTWTRPCPTCVPSRSATPGGRLADLERCVAIKHSMFAHINMERICLAGPSLAAARKKYEKLQTL